MRWLGGILLVACLCLGQETENNVNGTSSVGESVIDNSAQTAVVENSVENVTTIESENSTLPESSRSTDGSSVSAAPESSSSPDGSASPGTSSVVSAAPDSVAPDSAAPDSVAPRAESSSYSEFVACMSGCWDIGYRCHNTTISNTTLSDVDRAGNELRVCVNDFTECTTGCQ